MKSGDCASVDHHRRVGMRELLLNRLSRLLISEVDERCKGRSVVHVEVGVHP